MTAYAAPLLGGTLPKNSLRARMPPADAPRPTTKSLDDDPPGRSASVDEKKSAMAVLYGLVNHVVYGSASREGKTDRAHRRFRCRHRGAETRRVRPAGRFSRADLRRPSQRAAVAGRARDDFIASGAAAGDQCRQRRIASSLTHLRRTARLS